MSNQLRGQIIVRHKIRISPIWEFFSHMGETVAWTPPNARNLPPMGQTVELGGPELGGPEADL